MVKLYPLASTYRFLSLLAFLACVFQAEGQIRNDPGFNQSDRGFGYGDGPNAPVNVVQNLPDGKVLIAGNFTRYSGAGRKGIARLKGVNGLDSSFVPGTGFDGGVPLDLAVQTDGKIVVVGSFTQFNGLPANRIVRLNTNGSRDLTFGLGGSGPSGGAVREVELLPDGRIMVAGDFSTFNGFAYGAVVRLQTSGNLDLSFNPGSGGTTGTVDALRVQADGKVLLGGFFNNLINGISAQALVRLMPGGGADPSFSPPAINGPIRDIAVEASTGKLFVGGEFTSVNGANSSARVARLLPAGTVDATFQSPFLPGDGPVESVDLLSSQVIVAGSFVRIGSIRRGRIARLQSGGLVDGDFAADTGANGSIRSVDVAGNGKIAIAGTFTRFDQRGRSFVARIGALGNIDLPFSLNTGADRTVFAVAVQSDRKVIIGGDFGYFNWNFRNSLARLLANGQIDPGFGIGFGFNGPVRALLLQPDGKILVAGQFDRFNNLPARSLVRLNPDGTLDTGFNPGSGTPDSVLSLALQSDGKILVGGDFSSFSGQAAAGLVRLQANGFPDNTFNIGQGFSGAVRAIAVLRDSLIIAGGSFSSVNGLPRNGVAALTMSGQYMTIHNSGTGISSGGAVYALAIQPDRKVFAGGSFASYNGNPVGNLVRIGSGSVWDGSFNPGNLLDGPVYGLLYDALRKAITAVGDFGGAKATGRNGIVRMKGNGSRDRTQGTGPGTGGPAYAISSDVTGDLIISGEFDHFDSTGRNRVARLDNEVPDTTTWDGTQWEYGEPDSAMTAIIKGNYSGAGFNCLHGFVQAGRQFYPSSTVKASGDFVQNSTLFSGTVQMSGPALQSMAGYFDNLVLSNVPGFSLSGPTILRGTLTPQSGNLATNGHLILTSGSTGSARLGRVGSGVVLSGNATVRRYVPGGQAGWYFLGVPVTGQTRSDWADNFAIFPSSIFIHNEAGSVNIEDQVNGWELAGDNMVPGKGYRAFLNTSFFNASATFDNRGPLVTGAFPFPLTFTPGGYGGGGWNFIANPYACEVDWHAFSRTLVDGQIHVWNKTQYASYSQGAGLGVNGGDRYIAGFQGFFVKAASAGSALSIDESAKPIIPQAHTFLRVASEVPADAGRFIMRGGPDGAQDETAIRWMPGATDAFDNNLDADKLMNPGLSFFSMTSDGRQTSIQARNFDVSDEVDFGYSASQTGSYFLEVHLGSQIFAGKTWYLKDNETGSVYNLENPDFILPFEVSSGLEFSTFRFTLGGTTVTAKRPDGFSVPGPLVFPNPAADKIFVQYSGETLEFELLDMHGKIWARGSTDPVSGRAWVPARNLPAGLYSVRYRGGLCSGIRKVMIRP